MAVAAANHLLSALAAAGEPFPGDDYERVHLTPGQALFRPGDEIEWLYFPDGCLITLSATVPDARRSEVALVGLEGCAGLPVLLGGRAFRREEPEMAGWAWRVPARRVASRVGASPAMDAVLRRYLLCCLVEASVHATCARSHSRLQQVSRWLLEIRDRVGMDEFPTTQLFLAQLLGVRRQTVNETAGRLLRDGAIGYSRGKVRILDGERLREQACACYDLLHDAWSRLERPAD
jgi:CRP-like cAMP-binding protein